MKWDVGDVANVPNVLNILNVPKRLPRLPSSNFGRRPAANLPCLDWGRNTTAHFLVNGKWDEKHMGGGVRFFFFSNYPFYI